MTLLWCSSLFRVKAEPQLVWIITNFCLHSVWKMPKISTYGQKVQREFFSENTPKTLLKMPKLTIWQNETRF